MTDDPAPRGAGPDRNAATRHDRPRRAPTRRRFLAACGAAALPAVAGCGGLVETRSVRSPPLVADRPDAVYLPTHAEGMVTVDTASDGPYRCALTSTYPHRFWLVTGRRRQRVDVAPEDSVHLMPVVRHAETGIVPPDVNPRVSVARDGQTVTEFAPWPMLSQPMGFHFGDNVALGGDGTYRVEVSVGAPSARRTGSLAVDRGASFAFEFRFSRSTLRDIAYRDIPDGEQGTPGAVDPMAAVHLPGTRAPRESAMPGTVRGAAESGDARFVVTTLPDASRFGGDGTYLAVSPRTPYNRYVLPLLSLSATLTRGEEAVFDGPLSPALDPALRHHYGALVDDVAAGDALDLVVDAPPQVARHEGYETAFLAMHPMRLTL